MRNISNEYAVSEVVGYIMIITILVTAISTITFWYVPYVDQVKAEYQSNNILSQFWSLNEAINDLANQGSNASTSVDLKIEKGSIGIDSYSDRVVIYCSTIPDSSYNFYVTGLDDSDTKFNINLTRASLVDVKAEAVRLNDSASQDDINAVANTFKEFDVGSSEIDSISDAFKIILSYDTGGSTYEEFGFIWVFDILSIDYKLASNSGTYRVIFENGAVLHSYPSSSYVRHEPLIFKKGAEFAIRVIQFQEYSGFAGFGGTGKMSMNLITNETRLLRSKNVSYNLKICFCNEYNIDSEAWSAYFRLNHDFIRDAYFTDTVTLPGLTTFTLTSYTFDVGLEVST